MNADDMARRSSELDARHQELERQEIDLLIRAEAIASEEARLKGVRSALENDTDTLDHTAHMGTHLANSKRVQGQQTAIDQQQEALLAVLLARARELDARQAELEAEATRRTNQLDLRLATCVEREQELDRIEVEVRNRTIANALSNRELLAREEAVLTAERERDAGFIEAKKAFEQDLCSRLLELEQQAEALRQRESAIAMAEVVRDNGFTAARQALDLELYARRQQTEEAISRLHTESVNRLEQELSVERQKRLEVIERELEASRSHAQATIAAERKTWEEGVLQANGERATAKEEINRLNAQQSVLAQELDLRERTLNERESALEVRRLALSAEVEQRVELRVQSLNTSRAALQDRMEAFDDEVDQAVAYRRASFDQKEQALEAELKRLQGQIQTADRMSSMFENLKKQLGGRDAELVLTDLKTQQIAINRLREDVAKTPLAGAEEQERLLAERNRIQQLNTQQAKELELIKARLRGEDSIRRDLLESEGKVNWLDTQNEALRSQCEQQAQEIKRLTSAFQRDSDREARIRDIQPIMNNEEFQQPLDTPKSEIDWLREIETKCKNHGFHFHPRILRAFHTALKTAEWSPLTVLAGVSGTGKSELPRLYAHFGGMTFKSLPVQPNWDSQEAMLGYFNSIENRFDAEPLLRLLQRSSQPQDAKSRGLSQSLVLILLDEMNIAHPELYFAQFLSKLELRRSTKNEHLPKLEVKLGSGILPYELPLDRNVLWAGTMNQDETTNSLSDKVLDRSIVINFPRPAYLHRRLENKPLPAPSPLLHRKVWGSWWAGRSNFSDEEIAPFKGIIEDINGAMSKVGRALGHRVWQSIEYYMANYPDTLDAQRRDNPSDIKAAMRIAFEDQLVQKVMPKLRGIETRGRSKTDCLDKVRMLLAEQEYAILDDFDLSCEFGYGQFIWQTSSFLQESSPSSTVPPTSDSPVAP